MYFFLVTVATVTLAFITQNLWRKNELSTIEDSESYSNGGESGWGARWYWDPLVPQYRIEYGQYIFSTLYSLCFRMTIINLILFLLRYLAMSIYVWKSMKSFYTASRERIHKKQLEFDDIKLQVEIMNSKLGARVGEMEEARARLRRSVRRLREARARVRAAAAARAAPGDHPGLLQQNNSPEEEREFIMELLKELKCEPEPEIPSRNLESGEQVHDPTEPNSTEQSIYSSLNDPDSENAECRVKIVRVTNVYRVAYLKNYIKQKRIRRANKQALLKKKVESIKNMLEEWQKTLSMVISSKNIMSNVNPNQIDVESYEAMGDCSKPNLREVDSDCDMKSRDHYDDYALSWGQNYRSYGYNAEEPHRGSAPNGYYECRDLDEVKYPQSQHVVHYCEGHGPNLFMVPEETNSQLAIEEIHSYED